MKFLLTLIIMMASPLYAIASGGESHSEIVDFTRSAWGYMGVFVFVAAYALVPFEHNIHLRKSKPVLFAAGIIWIFVALAYIGVGDTHTAHVAIKHSLLEYAELFLFLLVAMTYINALEERNVFQSLRAYLVSRGFSLKQIFWITGVLSFLISPIADNLTTALLMGAVVMAVGGSNKKFITIACINIVVAANAGGAFSPFGDITTLMVWQKGKVSFTGFFAIMIPSLVNWIVPAIIMSFAIGKDSPEVSEETVTMKYGAKMIMGLFLLTIITAVSFHNFLNLPPAAGMMFGLAYIGICSFYIKRHEGRSHKYDRILGIRSTLPISPQYETSNGMEGVTQIVENIHYPAFAIDTSHTIVHWNERMEELTGASAKDRIGTNDHWSPFYKQKRRVLADLVIDEMPEEDFDRHYPGKHLRCSKGKTAHQAADHFESIGDDGEWLSMAAVPVNDNEGKTIAAIEIVREQSDAHREQEHFDLMKRIANAEWDTLLFFYGVILCVGGLGQFGYLGLISNIMYTDLGPTIANSLVGVFSAIIDNIPVMFAVLSMDPAMSLGQWLLVTLTAGTGGSMLAIGSAAGVALMGTARGTYTFGAHLKWTPVIMIGYIISIFVHLYINAKLM